MAAGAVLVAFAFGPGSGGAAFVLPLTVAELSRSSSYLGQSIGVALAGAVLVGVLLASTSSGVQASPVLSAEQQQAVQARIDAGVAVSAASDEQVRTALQEQGASPQVVEEAVRINSRARGGRPHRRWRRGSPGGGRWSASLARRTPTGCTCSSRARHDTRLHTIVAPEPHPGEVNLPDRGGITATRWAGCGNREVGG